MNKYILTFSDGSKHAVWAIDAAAARFHLAPQAKKYGLKIIKTQRAEKAA